MPYAGLTDSRTGVEASLWGLLGVKLGWVEGVELNFLGAGGGARPAPARRETARFRPHRHRRRYRHRSSRTGEVAPARDTVTRICLQFSPFDVTRVTPCASLPPEHGANAMRDTWPLLEQMRVSADPARAARHAAGQRRLSLQPVLRPLPRQCRPEPHRRDVGRDGRHGARVPRAPARHDARHHRRRAGAEPALPPAGARRARHGRARDRPLQPHDPGAAGPGGPRRVPRRASRSRSWPRCRATWRTMSTASAARACSTARSAG